MEILYVNVKEKLEEIGLNYPTLNIFEQRGTIIGIAQWQPKGIIGFERSRGFFSKEESHVNKAEKFIESADAFNADVVVTPEYSFPWELLKQILLTKSIEMQYGVLWCLGMEGISYSNFNNFVRDCNQCQDVLVITEDLKHISRKNFLSCLVYVFKTSEKTVCLIQLKTTAASDKWAVLEASGLTTGNTIYYFDDNSGGNCFMSVICADALNQVNTQINDKIKYSKYLVLHPQMNPKPMHESFVQMRSNLLKFSFNNMRILTQNWSKDSVLQMEGDNGEIKIQDSYSACYYCENANFDNLYKRNKAKGMKLSTDDHILIWHMPEGEHCMFYYIDTFNSNGMYPVAGNHMEPLGAQYMEFNTDNNEWKDTIGCNACSIDWNWLKEKFDFEPCKEEACNIIKLHRFFSILFAKDMYEDLRINNGKSQIVFNKLQQDVEEIYKQRERSDYIINALEKEIIPAKFSELKNHNFRWVLKEKGNLETKSNGQEESNQISVVYIDSGTEYSINKGIMKFKKLMGANETECMDRMILYFLSSEGLKYYDKIYNTSINNPNKIHAIAEIN